MTAVRSTSPLPRTMTRSAFQSARSSWSASEIRQPVDARKATRARSRSCSSSTPAGEVDAVGADGVRATAAIEGPASRGTPRRPGRGSERGGPQPCAGDHTADNHHFTQCRVAQACQWSADPAIPEPSALARRRRLDAGQVRPEAAPLRPGRDRPRLDGQLIAPVGPDGSVLRRALGKGTGDLRATC
jgi:hypothetical protein